MDYKYDVAAEITKKFEKISLSSNINEMISHVMLDKSLDFLQLECLHL